MTLASRLIVLAAVIAVFLVACSGEGNDVRGIKAIPAGKSTNPSAHVFVASYSGGVYRFPIVNGIAASTADGSFATTFPECPPECTSTYVGDMKVDRNGFIYVVAINYDISRSQLDVYAPGASGADKPLRTLDLPPRTQHVTVDDNGYIYTGKWIYAPGAKDNDAPVQSVPVGSLYDYLGGLLVDPGGVLYVSAARQVYQWRNPLTNPTLVRTVCYSGQRWSVYGGLAVDSASSHLFIAEESFGGRNGAILALPTWSNACPLGKGQHRIIPSRRNGRYPFLPESVAFSNGYVFATDLENDAVYEMPVGSPIPRTGKTSPVATLTGVYSPVAVAIGP